jgi:glutamate/tyrosine decarboxylase-like PLP-dependent enzyme
MKTEESTGPEALMRLTEDVRKRLWSQVATSLERYIQGVAHVDVAPPDEPEAIFRLLQGFTFNTPMEPAEVVDQVIEALWTHQVHTPHPRYFGLFNPAPAVMGVFGDLIAAVFNPQLATRHHSPFAVAAERHLIRTFGVRFGFPPEEADGAFTSGGAEANLTAVTTALAARFPQVRRSGLRALTAQPVMYVSAHAHHSFQKAARICGLGESAVRSIPVDDDHRMDAALLASQIEKDKRRGDLPFLVAATAGTTNAGAVDPIGAVANQAAYQELWFHVDAAWGGAAVLIPELRSLLDGVEKADSITFDAHKWMSVPMGAGMFLTRHAGVLSRAFGIQTSYMPADSDVVSEPDPYTHSIQWSRRFIGLKLFMTLAAAGFDGYEAMIRRQVEMGILLRLELEADDWRTINRTQLPLVCFIDDSRPDGDTRAYLSAVADYVTASGKAWISVTDLGPETPALRACITHYGTTADDVRLLVKILHRARRSIS